MLDEEQEPLFVENLSSSSSSHHASETDKLFLTNDYDFHNRIKSVTVLNIRNPSQQSTNKEPFKNKQHKITKKPKKKYDYVESKVKQYIINVKREQQEHKKLQEQRKAESMKQLQMETKTQEATINNDIQITNDNLSEVDEKCIDLPETYNEVMRMIEQLDVQEFHVKNDQDSSKTTTSVTPPFHRKSSIKCTPKSLKKLLFRKYSLTTPAGLSAIDINSTCRTEDIEDSILNNSQFINDFEIKFDPFIAKSTMKDYLNVDECYRQNNQGTSKTRTLHPKSTPNSYGKTLQLRKPPLATPCLSPIDTNSTYRTEDSFSNNSQHSDGCTIDFDPFITQTITNDNLNSQVPLLDNKNRSHSFLCLNLNCFGKEKFSGVVNFFRKGNKVHPIIIPKVKVNVHTSENDSGFKSGGVDWNQHNCGNTIKTIEDGLNKITIMANVLRGELQKLKTN